RLVQQELNGQVPLIGFCGSPWTLAAYMIEGQANIGFPIALKMLHEEPLLLHTLLDILAESVYAHLSAQIAAGVQVVMLFDTWGGILNTQDYKEFSLNYVERIISKLLDIYPHRKVPVLLFTK